MELREYLLVFRRWWGLLLLGLLLGGGVGYAVAQSRIPLYQTQSTLIIGRYIQSVDFDTGEMRTAQQLAQIYADLIQREPLLQATVEALELEMDWTTLREKINAQPVPETQLLALSVTDTDPQRAMLIADEITQQLILQSPTSNLNEEEAADQAFVKGQLAELRTNITNAQQQIQELRAALQLETTEAGVERRQAQIDGLQSKLDTWQNNYASLLGYSQTTENRVNRLTVIEPPGIPEAPINASGRRDVVLAAVVGLLLAAGVVYLLEYMDDTIKTPEDAQHALGMTTLGTIPKIKVSRRQNGQGQMVTTEEAYSPVAEAYRTLRTNIQFSSLFSASSTPTLLVTSAAVGEGKSTVVANLAVVMAQSAKQVILVDADLRRPTLHKLFGLSNDTGLTSLFLDRSLAPQAVLQKTTIGSLRILPTGPLPPNAADMLDSEYMTGLIERLAEQADIVIFDTPPLLAVSDASILASQVGSAIMVIGAAQTRSQICQHGLKVLEQVGITPIGVVLNKFNPKQSAYYSYGYYNYYSSRNGASGHRKKKQI